MTTNANGNGAAKRDPVSMLRLEALVANAWTSRADLWRRLADPRRDLYAECGYPANPVPLNVLQDLYDRDPLSCRVVQVLARESWQVQPGVFESEDADTVTAFEEAWDALGNQLRGEESYYADEAGSAVWEYLRRADELSGIGSYGVILLGFDDGKPLREPVKAAKGLIYLRVFPESLAQILEYEKDRTSPRFGQPTRYGITINDPSGQTSGNVGLGFSTSSEEVHWSRVIHVADNLESSEVFGVPRMRPVLNRLLDLQKVYGGDGEAYWKNCLLKIFFETNPAMGGDVDVDMSALRDDMEAWGNGMQQWLLLKGMAGKTVAPSVVDPTSHINIQIEAICIKLGIPIRVFKGSERGELASSQDDAAWNDRLRQRQSGYITPRIIVPFVNRLISVGVLPKPADGFCVDWPDLASQTDTELASIAAQKTASLAAYVGGGVDALMPPLDYLTRVLGYTEEEAQAILDNAEKLAEEEMQDAEEQAELQPGQPPVDEDGQPVPPQQGQPPNPFGQKVPVPSANAGE